MLRPEYRKGIYGGFDFFMVEDTTDQLRFNTDRIFALVTIDVMSDKQYVCLHKHGREETVKLAYNRISAYDSTARIIDLSDGMVTDINHFINTSALPVSWLDRFTVLEQ